MSGLLRPATKHGIQVSVGSEARDLSRRERVSFHFVSVWRFFVQVTRENGCGTKRDMSVPQALI